jgi:predicted GIY-YIG superfamily endonuclease
LWDGHRKVYIGRTNDPESRETAHQRDKKFNQMKIEGPKVSEETALEWEQEALEKYRLGHGGKSPKYND